MLTLYQNILTIATAPFTMALDSETMGLGMIFKTMDQIKNALLNPIMDQVGTLTLTLRLAVPTLKSQQTVTGFNP